MMLKFCLKTMILLSACLLQSKDASCQRVTVKIIKDNVIKIFNLESHEALTLARIIRTHQDPRYDIDECATSILNDCVSNQTCVDLPKANDQFYRCDGNSSFSSSFNLNCGDGDKIEIKLPTKYFTDLDVDPNKLHLTEPSCVGINDGSFVVFTFKTNECGSTMLSTDSSLVYSNEVTNTIQLGNIIYEQTKVKLSFRCSYSKHLNASVSIHHLTTTYIVASHEIDGNITVQLWLFNDSAFTNALTRNTQVKVGQTLYVLANHTFALSKYHLRLRNCWLTPDSNPHGDESLEIIKDYNPTSQPLSVASNLRTGESASFDMKVVRFSSSQDLYLHCALMLCDSDALECSRRRRRSVDDMRHTFSVGPILLERSAGEDDSESIESAVSENQESNVSNASSTSSEAVIGVLCAALVVAIVIAVIMYRKRKSDQHSLNRPNFPSAFSNWGFQQENYPDLSMGNIGRR